MLGTEDYSIRLIREMFWVINANLVIGHSSMNGFFLISHDELWASTHLVLDGRDVVVVRAA